MVLAQSDKIPHQEQLVSDGGFALGLNGYQIRTASLQILCGRKAVRPYREALTGIRGS